MSDIKIPKELHGRTVGSAVELFTAVAEAMGISSYFTPDLGSGIMFQHLIDQAGWLPPLMMRMDIESRILTGSALWEVTYVRDSETVCGITANDRSSERPGEPPPMFMMKSLCKHAINETILVDHAKKECRLRPLPVYYLCNIEEEEGSSIELPDEDIVFSVEFNGLMMNYMRGLAKAREFKPDFPSL